MFRPHLVRSGWKLSVSHGLQEFSELKTSSAALFLASNLFFAAHKAVLLAGCGAGSIGGTGPVQELYIMYTYIHTESSSRMAKKFRNSKTQERNLVPSHVVYLREARGSFCLEVYCTSCAAGVERRKAHHGGGRCRSMPLLKLFAAPN